MLGKTNATTGAGGSGSNDKTYNYQLACDYMQDLIEGRGKKADILLLDVLHRGGNPYGLYGKWTYKPADFNEYMHDILTSNNMAACLILDRVVEGVSAQ